MVKGTNWIKGFALFGMMVALVGMLAIAPGASAATATSARLGASPVPVANVGKISVFAHDLNSPTIVPIAGASVIVTEYNSDVVVLKGTTDANGRFSSYIAEGVYQVSITAKSYKEFSQVVKIAAGQSTSLSAGLELGASDN